MRHANIHTTAIIGAGISGLTTAYTIVKQAKEENLPIELHLYESSSRIGGKIQTMKQTEGKKSFSVPVDLGAEFIDSDAKATQNLCAELGINTLKDTSNGHLFGDEHSTAILGDAFYTGMKPIQAMIIADKKEVADNPEGEKAQQLNELSFQEYLDVLMSNPALQANKTTLEEGVAILKGAYIAEVCNAPEKLSALNFIYESSDKFGTLFSSDCGIRIEGGTEQLIVKLKEYLEAEGVQLHTATKAVSLGKGKSGKIRVGFENSDVESVFNSVVLATNTHAIAHMEGITSFGITPQEVAVLETLGYAESAKFSVKITADTVENKRFWSHKGYECWLTAPDVLTFFAGGALAGQDKEVLITHCLQDFASTTGSSMEKLLGHDRLEKSDYLFSAPNHEAPCYASPAKSEMFALQAITEKLKTGDTVKEHGLGVVGTFFPAQDGAVGFINNGVEIAQTVAKQVVEKALKYQNQKPSGHQNLRYENPILSARKSPAEKHRSAGI